MDRVKDDDEAAGRSGLTVTPAIRIGADELIFTPLRAAAGPGGQNVNKVASAVELRFDARRSRSLSNEVSIRLQKLAGARLTQEGVIVIRVTTHRSQERNREEALERLAELIGAAGQRPKRRIATKIPKAAKAERRQAKAKRGAVKNLRGKVAVE